MGKKQVWSWVKRWVVRNDEERLWEEIEIPLKNQGRDTGFEVLEVRKNEACLA